MGGGVQTMRVGEERKIVGNARGQQRGQQRGDRGRREAAMVSAMRCRGGGEGALL